VHGHRHIGRSKCSQCGAFGKTRKQHLSAAASNEIEESIHDLNISRFVHYDGTAASWNSACSDMTSRDLWAEAEELLM